MLAVFEGNRRERKKLNFISDSCCQIFLQEWTVFIKIHVKLL